MNIIFRGIYDGSAIPLLSARGQHSAKMPLSRCVALEQPRISNDLAFILNKKVDAPVVNVIVLRLKDMLLTDKYIKPRPDNLEQFGQRQFAECFLNDSMVSTHFFSPCNLTIFIW